jgi:hypothetical protein
MRLLICLALWLVPGPCEAWDTGPHQRITKAALDSLPKRLLKRFQSETAPLIQIYCMYPDRYLEMERFGFARNSPGPREPSEIRRYCVRPDGRNVHGATGDRDTDIGSMVYLFERILTSFSENQPTEAARYAGVLSHFIEDSLSPPHAVTSEQLRDMAGQPGETSAIDIHSAIERSLPEFTLGNRAAPAGSVHLLAAIEAIVDRCYAGAEQNRRDLPSIVKAVYARDERALDTYRLRAGAKGAEILADALYIASETGGGRAPGSF